MCQVDNPARRDQLKRGSLYGAFGDKHAIYLAALDAYMASALGLFVGLRDAHDDPVDAVRAFVRLQGEDCQSGKGAERSCMISTACGELLSTDAIARERVQGYLQSVQTAIASALAVAQERGTFDAHRDPAAVALFIQTSMQGLNLLAQSRPPPGAIDGVVAEILRTLDSAP